MRIDQPHALHPSGSLTRRPSAVRCSRSASPSRPNRTWSARTSSTRWSSFASTRPNWPIGCNRSKARWIAASGHSPRKRPIWKPSGRTPGNGSASGSRSSKNVPRSLAGREQELAEREALAEDRATQLTQVREEALAERETRLDGREAELAAQPSRCAARLAALGRGPRRLGRAARAASSSAKRRSKRGIANWISDRRSCIAISSN